MFSQLSLGLCTAPPPPPPRQMRRRLCNIIPISALLYRRPGGLDSASRARRGLTVSGVQLPLSTRGDRTLKRKTRQATYYKATLFEWIDIEVFGGYCRYFEVAISWMFLFRR